MKKSIFRITAPTQNWFDGHILGNGDLGAVVWGSPAEFCVGLSKHDVNLNGDQIANRGWEAAYPELVKRVKAGDRSFLERYGYGVGTLNGPYQLSCGRLSLQLIRDDYTPVFRQQLDWRCAECRIVAGMPEKYHQSIGVPQFQPITLSIKVLAGANLVLVRLSCPQQRTAVLCYSAGTMDNPSLPPPVFHRNRMTRELPEQNSLAVAIDGADLRPTAIGLVGNVTFGGNAGDMVLTLAVAASAETANPVRAAKKLLQRDVVKLEQDHQDWWRQFWQKSNISYGDKTIEELWRFGVYALGSATRPNKLPPNLQGIWNQCRVPAWHCDFHFNANIQEAHWLCGPTNHAELEMALVRCLLFDWRDQLRATARATGLPGVMFPLAADWKGRPLCWTTLSLAMSMTAWMSMHLENYLQYANHVPWESEILTFYRECCELYLAILQPGADGHLHVELSESPEQVEFKPDGSARHVCGRDPAIDLAAIGILFNNFLKLSAKKQQTSDKLFNAVKEAASRLAPLPIHNDHLIDLETGFFAQGDGPGEFQVSHRHPSRLFPIFPGCLWGMGHNEQLAVNSFREFLSYGEYGFSSWSLAWQAAIAAHLGLADEIESILQRMVHDFQFSGGLFNHGCCAQDKRGALPIFQFEATAGAAAAITEMLLCKVDKTVYLFPGVPPKRCAAFRNLRLPGGFLVSATKDSKRISAVSIKSLDGGSLIVASRYNVKKQELSFSPGEFRTLSL